MIHAHDGGNPQVPFHDKPSFVFLLNASLSDFFKNRTDPQGTPLWIYWDRKWTSFKAER